MRICFLFYLFFLPFGVNAQKVAKNTQMVAIDSAWASNSINAVIFRKNALVSFRDTQFVAFYNQEGFVVLGKRKVGETNWQLQKTPYQGQITDAHNSISIMVDGAGYLHVAWDHHNHPLRYTRSERPGSLELQAKMLMTGLQEDQVTYPEFYRLPDGNLLFFYRDGVSGRGNLVINRYDTSTQSWTQLHPTLIDGEDQRNAYWQAYVDVAGTIHLSWVWRETWDVSSNHDLAYARSPDGGLTWEKSTGEKYQLPITAAQAEYACRIPEKSELINQTSMYADENGQPYIATYWRTKEATVPQFHLVYKKGTEWVVQNLGFRQTPFSLSGGGTKRIPISRPQLVSWKKGKKQQVAIIFRDAERGRKVSLALNRNMQKNKWKVFDLWDGDVGEWEPTYDTELWKEKGILHLLVQHVQQIDGEGVANKAPEMVWVLEWMK